MCSSVLILIRFNLHNKQNLYNQTVNYIKTNVINTSSSKVKTFKFLFIFLSNVQQSTENHFKVYNRKTFKLLSWCLGTGARGLADGRLVDGGGALRQRLHALGHGLGGPADRVWTEQTRFRGAPRGLVLPKFERITSHVEVLRDELRGHQRSRYEVLVHGLEREGTVKTGDPGEALEEETDGAHRSEFIGLFEVVRLLHIVVTNQVGGDLCESDSDLVQSVVRQRHTGQLQQKGTTLNLLLTPRPVTFCSSGRFVSHLGYGSDDLPVLPGQPRRSDGYPGVLAPPLRVHIRAVLLRVCSTR